MPQSVLDDPSVDLVSVVEFWEKFEPTKGTFDFTYIDQQIKSVVAAGKNVLLRVLTMGGVADGSASAGHTPQHVWTDMSLGSQHALHGASDQRQPKHNDRCEPAERRSAQVISTTSARALSQRRGPRHYRHRHPSGHNHPERR